jgi:hypothetical protein
LVKIFKHEQNSILHKDQRNFYVIEPKRKQRVKASSLFTDLKMGQFRHHPKIVIINQIECYLFASDIKSKTGQPEYKFLISINNPKESAECFERRWQIEHEVVP